MEYASYLRSIKPQPSRTFLAVNNSSKSRRVIDILNSEENDCEVHLCVTIFYVQNKVVCGACFSLVVQSSFLQVVFIGCL